ncbi:MAG: NADH-quinone oxidoreductase subunit J [Acidimicrobiia bacterium]|jgi:NADH-quinone oxidoreductase subunit J
MVELVVFVIAAAICLGGAAGVILNRNPVHAALSLVATLFGIAVLFVAQEAHFLAAVQVIVYAGAIVILFLFVLMLLGVDRAEDLTVEPIRGQRLAAAIVGVGLLGLSLIALASTSGEATGARAEAGAANEITDGVADIDQIGESLFTDHLFAFEITSVLLVIAIVGAVMMSRKVRREQRIEDPLVAARAAELEARAAAEAEAPATDAPTDEEVEA